MKTKTLLTALLAISLVSCAPVTAPAPTETSFPKATLTPVPPSATTIPTSTPTATLTPVPPTAAAIPTSTSRPTKTPIPIVYVTLGSPFAADCGDGIPMIWSNDSFNGPFKQAFDDHHGHVDILPPKGCDLAGVKGGFLAPATGTITKYIISGNGTEPHTYGYHLSLPKGTYIEGVLEALKFSGIETPDLNKVSDIKLNIGHVHIPVEGKVEKGQSIGELLPGPWYPGIKIGYQVSLMYGRTEYMFSPTLFKQDGPTWICYPNSPYDCQPEPLDYAP